jgi:hypothetical protein
MKLTAIEWLSTCLITEPHTEKDFEHNEKCWDKAELIEYNQIREAFCNGETSHDRIDAQQYFKETYGK